MKKELFIQALYNEPSILNEQGYELLDFEGNGTVTVRSRKDNRLVRIGFNDTELPNEPLEALDIFLEGLDKSFNQLDKTIKELKGENDKDVTEPK